MSAAALRVGDAHGVRFGVGRVMGQGGSGGVFFWGGNGKHWQSQWHTGSVVHLSSKFGYHKLVSWCASATEIRRALAEPVAHGG